jgi:hypothetical protein
LTLVVEAAFVVLILVLDLKVGAKIARLVISGNAEIDGEMGDIVLQPERA